MESLYVPVIMKVAQVKNQKKQVYRLFCVTSTYITIIWKISS